MHIKSINIHSFRGIPNDLTIDFVKQDKCVSMLLYGDNGSGKSSIIDAIEFCLQARINRTKNLKNELAPFPISYYSNKDAKVVITFDKDNQIFSRKIILSNIETSDEVILVTNNSQPQELFSISPIVLRRKDILDFNNAPIKNKQVVLFDFLRDSQMENWEKNPSEELTSLEDEKLKIKNSRKKTITQLAKILKVSEDEIPLDMHKFDDFVREKIFKGLNKKQRGSFERKGVNVIVNEKALKCVNFIKSCYPEINKVNTQIVHLKRNNTVRLDKKKITVDILKNASEFISSSFNKIAKTDYIESLYLKLGDETEVSLNIEVELKNGKKGTPNNIFSEAYLDLIALLIFLSFLKESAKFGQSKLLILDDVLQSVDSTIRLSFADFLLKEFADWQLIISAHDRLWLNQLRNIFRQNNHLYVEKEIIRWEFSNGPILRNGSLDCIHPLKYI
jgi:hypothetical protein